MAKLCIFDLDGTLTNTIPAISHFGNTALSQFGFPQIDPERYKLHVGNGRDLLVHRMLADFNADTPENFDNVGKAYDRAYEANPLYGTKPYDGIPELLKLLKENKIKTAVLSNKPDNVVTDIVRLFFGDLFDIVHGQRAGINTKPDPHAALEIMNELGTSPDNTYFIGDTNVDIFTGKNGGMHTIGVLWGFRTKSELEDAGSEFIVSHPHEIGDIILK